MTTPMFCITMPSRQFFWHAQVRNYLGMIANFFLAQIKIKKNEYEDAVELLTELLAQTPNLSEGHYMLGQAYYALHKQTEAIQAFRRVLETNPEDQRAKTKLTLMTDVEW